MREDKNDVGRCEGCGIELRDETVHGKIEEGITTTGQPRGLMGFTKCRMKMMNTASMLSISSHR